MSKAIYKQTTFDYTREANAIIDNMFRVARLRKLTERQEAEMRQTLHHVLERAYRVGFDNGAVAVKTGDYII